MYLQFNTKITEYERIKNCLQCNVYGHVEEDKTEETQKMHGDLEMKFAS